MRDTSKTWGNPQAGDVVDVYLASKQFCGRGFYNSHSKIQVRLLTFHDDVIDAEFFRTRIQSAARLRQRMALSSNAYRLVHGESDLLPGLIIDRYGDVAVMQTLSYGMDQRKELLADLVMRERESRQYTFGTTRRVARWKACRLNVDLCVERVSRRWISSRTMLNLL